jgi:hypothetical protein
LKCPSQCTSIPVCVDCPLGEFPFATLSNSEALHLETPLHFASLSNHHPITCSVSCLKLTGSIFWASCKMVRGFHGFPARTVAISICNQRNGVCQLTCFAPCCCFSHLRPRCCRRAFLSSLYCRWGRDCSATAPESFEDVLS